MQPTENKSKVILSLFDYTGTWSDPYTKAGYQVVKFDLANYRDVLNFDFSIFDKYNVYGILSAPPCTHFTKASQHLWLKYDLSGQTEISIKCVRKVLELADQYKPKFWVIENPPGRIVRLIPELKKFRLIYFHPYYYGDPYKKQTDLYGVFNPFLVRNYVDPVFTHEFGWNNHGIEKYYKSLGYSGGRSFLRSITPPGFANAFYNANK